MGNDCCASSRPALLTFRSTCEATNEYLGMFNYKLYRQGLSEGDEVVLNELLTSIHKQISELLVNTALNLNRRERESLRHNKEMITILLHLMAGRKINDLQATTNKPMSLQSMGRRVVARLFESVDELDQDGEKGAYAVVEDAKGSDEKFEDAPDGAFKMEDVKLSEDKPEELKASEEVADIKTTGTLPTLVEETKEAVNAASHRVDDKATYGTRLMKECKEAANQGSAANTMGEVVQTLKHDLELAHEQRQLDNEYDQIGTLPRRRGGEQSLYGTIDARLPLLTRTTTVSNVDIRPQLAVVTECVSTLMKWSEVKLERSWFVSRVFGTSRSVFLVGAFIFISLTVAFPVTVALPLIAWVFTALCEMADLGEQLYSASNTSIDPDRALRENGPRKVRAVV